MKKTGIFLIGVILVLAFVYFYTENTSQEKTLYLMDTVINLKIKGNKNDMNALCDILEKYDLKLNAHNQNSEIYKINHGKKEMEPDVEEILLKGYELCELTDGAFDYTVKPLTDLWGISDGNTTVPQKEEIAKTLLKTGYDKVSFDVNNINLSDAEIDLGGIAKGFVTQKLIDEIKNRNIKRAIIDLGGNIYVYDAKKDVKVGIQKPFSQRGEVLLSLDVNDASVISSGTYERYFEYGGKIYHHIFDPETGYPADNGTDSVTVIGSPLKGDALSTALFVMDIEKATNLYRSENDFEFITVKGKKIYATEGIFDKITLSDKDYELIKIKKQN